MGTCLCPSYALEDADAALLGKRRKDSGPLAEFRAHPIKAGSFTPLSREDANAR